MERRIDLPVPIDEVWVAVTRAERLSAWFGAVAVEVELHPGGRITFDRDGTPLRGLVEAVDAPSMFAFRWLSGSTQHARTRVEFHLEAVGGGTVLTVREVPAWEPLRRSAVRAVGAHP
jgi:uncharacterized protein YndB with AHSA1/START domain